MFLTVKMTHLRRVLNNPWDVSELISSSYTPNSHDTVQSWPYSLNNLLNFWPFLWQSA